MLKKTLAVVTLGLCVTSGAFAKTEEKQITSPEQFISELKNVCTDCAKTITFISQIEKDKCDKPVTVESMRNTAKYNDMFAFLLGMQAIAPTNFSHVLDVAKDTADCNPAKWVEKTRTKLGKV